MEKKRLVISYEKLSPKLRASLDEQYPNGYAEQVMRVESPTPFLYVLLEADEATYMVKLLPAGEKGEEIGEMDKMFSESEEFEDELDEEEHDEGREDQTGTI